jgi:hypothetical protein
MQMFIDPFTAQGLTDAIEEAVKKSADNEGALIEAYTRKHDEYTKEDYFEIIKPYVAALAPIIGDGVQEIIATELGEGRKVTSATDEEVFRLENIYNNLAVKAAILGIEV